MSDFSTFHSAENEELHRMLFQFHRDLYGSALERIKNALMLLHKLEAHPDIRAQVRAYIQEFECLREASENLLHNAADFRTKVIRENGCEGCCHGS